MRKIFVPDFLSQQKDIFEAQEGVDKDSRSYLNCFYGTKVDTSRSARLQD